MKWRVFFVILFVKRCQTQCCARFWHHLFDMQVASRSLREWQHVRHAWEKTGKRDVFVTDTVCPQLDGSLSVCVTQLCSSKKWLSHKFSLGSFETYLSKMSWESTEKGNFCWISLFFPQHLPCEFPRNQCGNCKCSQDCHLRGRLPAQLNHEQEGTYRSCDALSTYLTAVSLLNTRNIHWKIMFIYIVFLTPIKKMCDCDKE